MSTGETPRQKVQRLSKQTHETQIAAEKKIEEAEQQRTEQRQTIAAEDRKKTETLYEVFEEALHNIKLPATGQQVTVSLSKTPSKFFWTEISDEVPYVFVSVSYGEGNAPVLMARYRDEGYALMHIDSHLIDGFDTSEKCLDAAVVKVSNIDKRFNERLNEIISERRRTQRP